MFTRRWVTAPTARRGVRRRVGSRDEAPKRIFITVARNQMRIRTDSSVAAAEEDLLHLGLAGCELIHQVRLELHNLVKVGTDSDVT